MRISIFPGGTGGGGVTAYATFADLPASATAGTVAVVTDTDTLYIYDDNTSSWIPVGGSTVAFTRTGSAALTSGDQSKAIVFSSDFGTTNYQVIVSWGNTVDADPIYPSFVITNKASTGFTVEFNAPVDSNNYTLNYIAVLNT